MSKRPLKKTDALIVVRIVTSAYKTQAGLALKKEIRFLRRLSVFPDGFNFVEEDSSQSGADKVIERITNLGTVADGIYKMEMTNVSHDWEQPHIADDWDYTLYPYDPEKSLTPHHI